QLARFVDDMLLDEDRIRIEATRPQIAQKRSLGALDTFVRLRCSAVLRKDTGGLTAFVITDICAHSRQTAADSARIGNGPSHAARNRRGNTPLRKNTRTSPPGRHQPQI